MENKISIPVNVYFTFFFFFKVIASVPQIKLAILVSPFYPITTNPRVHELKCEAGLYTLLVVWLWANSITCVLVFWFKIWAKLHQPLRSIESKLKWGNKYKILRTVPDTQSIVKMSLYHTYLLIKICVVYFSNRVWPTFMFFPHTILVTTEFLLLESLFFLIQFFHILPLNLQQNRVNYLSLLCCHCLNMLQFCWSTLLLNVSFLPVLSMKLLGTFFVQV